MNEKTVKAFLAYLCLSLAPATAAAGEVESANAERTLVAAIEVDRDGARLVAYTAKERPYVSPAEPVAASPYTRPGTFQLELRMIGPAAAFHTRRVQVGPLCLDHGADHLDHVQGDTILRHRDAFLVELPELPGFDRVEVAYLHAGAGGPVRRALAVETLDPTRFTPAAGPLRYVDLAFARPGAPPAEPAGSAVLWPDAFADPDIYRIYGDPTAGAERINVVIVPDGYTYAEKATMEAHAQAMVDHFRAKTPFAELDTFFNYTLVYGYSNENGTDQCDCGIVVDTAFGTRFPDAGNPCQDSGNRCLYYGGGCDGDGVANIVAAELRAPLHDETIVMVNTSRYGGCGGARGVYSAGNSAATEIAVHELGHSLAGLADEYVSQTGCGSNAGEVNTSIFADGRSWIEWKHVLGSAAREGAQYYSSCIYRPDDNCEMRALNQPFCVVCRQHWALITYAHPRVAPTAPLRGIEPPAAVSAFTDLPTTFALDTRLSSGAGVTHSFTWTLDSFLTGPLVVASGVQSYQHTFTEAGLFTLTAEIVADTNFIRPERNGPNVDTAIWTIEVEQLAPPPEISAPDSTEPVGFADPFTLRWEDGQAGGALSYNLYRGELTALGAGYGLCDQPDLPAPEANVGGVPAAGAGWFYLVTGRNPAGEGPLGNDSAGSLRINASPCP